MLHASPTLDDTRTGTTPRASSPRVLLIVLGCILFSVGLLVIPLLLGELGAFRYLYLALVLFLGLVLYRLFPVMYVGYIWWLWLLTPFIRRIVDYHAGWQEPSLITMGVYLATGLSMLTLVRHRTRIADKDFFPFILILAGMAYGFAVSVLAFGPVSAGVRSMKWIVPVFFGLHIALSWHDYPALRQCIRRTFLWGVALTGLYALIQFYVLPSWDLYWMHELRHLSTFGGNPKPLEMRVFSTLNAYEFFATVMMAGLIVLFSLPAWKHLLVAAPGYASFLLTLHRQSWGGWLVALVFMAAWTKGTSRTRLLGAVLSGTLVLALLLSVPAISDRIASRFESFQSMEEDSSLNTRIEQFQNTYVSALLNPIGNGIGDTSITVDSGLLVIPFQLGWPGTTLFILGLVMLLRRIWRGRRRTRDPFAALSTSIVFGLLAVLLFRNVLYEVGGTVFWCFAGLAVASYRYHYERAGDEEIPIDPAAEAASVSP